MDVKLTNLPDDNEIGVSCLSVTYCQQQDNEVRCPELDDQKLTISTVEADNGDYYYYLKTDRWAFDNIEEVITLFNDFEKRLRGGKNNVFQG